MHNPFPACLGPRGAHARPSPISPAETRVTLKEKVAYGLGDAASNFFFQFFQFFGVYYYTDIFGLPAKQVTGLMLVVRLFDAVLDPAVGIVADRTSTRWGKFRPYLLWGAVPFGLFGYLMFVNPGLSAGGKLTYAYFTYALVWIAYSAINIPYSALMGVMSPSSEERKSISTVRFTCAFVATLIITSQTVRLKHWLGGGDDAVGIRRTMLIFSVISTALFLVSFLGTRERVVPVAEKNASLKEDLRSLMRNRSWRALFALGLVLLASIGVRNAMVVYFFKYAAGAEDKLSLYNLLGFIAFIIGASLTRFFLKLGESRNVLISLYAAVGAIWILFFFIEPHAYVLVTGLNIVANFIAGPQPALLWAMYADCADFGEWRFGRRATALVFSSAVFSQKAGAAFGAAIVARLLDHYGFVANQVQSPHTIRGIVFMFSVLPGVLAIGAALLVVLYPLRDDVMRTVERELAERKLVPG